jgi:hypothetical protein
MSETTREELLELQPEDYLAPSFLGPDGAIRPELLASAAVAAATQLAEEETSPQEMAFTYESLRALLAMQDGSVENLEALVGEAFAMVGRMIRQPNNEGLVSWCLACIDFVRHEADMVAFLAHMQAVLRLLALLASLPPPGEISSSEPFFS